MKTFKEINRMIERMYEELGKYPADTDAFHRLRGKISALEWVLDEVDEP